MVAGCGHWIGSGCGCWAWSLDRVLNEVIIGQRVFKA